MTARDRLLATATRLFCQHGVNLSLHRAITEADVALMTVYRHFGGKEGLVVAVLDRWSSL